MSKWYKVTFFLIFVLMVCVLTGCSWQKSVFPILEKGADDKPESDAVQSLLDSDPGGPIPAPEIPPDLISISVANPQFVSDTKTLEYTVICDSTDGTPELADSFLKNSLLVRLKDIPLDNIAGLEQRLKMSLKEGEDILHSFGYYAGKVEGFLEDPNGKEIGAGSDYTSDKAIVVRVVFKPGPLYCIGNTTVICTDYVSVKAKSAEFLPKTLSDVGLEHGSPAKADDVLAAVGRITDIFHNNGYPLATISSSRYVLDHETRLLEAEVKVIAGDYIYMGDLKVCDGGRVRLSYIKALKTWDTGEPWNQEKVEIFRDNLNQSGLFRLIEIEPDDIEDGYGHKAVVTKLDMAPERTIGGALKYDTSFGLGVQGFWEHRNFTGRGDSLRFEMPLWLDMQEFTAKYNLPFFMRNDQSFIAQGGILNQDTDAYDLQSASVAAGIERRLNSYWSLTVQGSAEGGWLKDPSKPREMYMMFGMPLGVAFSNANSMLDATRGGRLMFSAAPYTGKYDGAFNVVRSRLDMHYFMPLAGRDSVVLAFRGSIGTLWGADSYKVPPSVRFYGGGGGSVRGYEHQSLGPRNENDDPLGGNSLLEISMESRFKINDQWGVVAFLDGGMVYDKFDSDYGKHLRWGAGLGLRLFTAIGPVRFDIATPLNSRDSDSFLQFYISIGQSF